MKKDEVLNDLIEINNDRNEGYKKAARQTSDEDLRSLFTNMANQSTQNVSELKMLLSGEEKPADGTTLRGKIYRTWMDVKATFGGDDRKSLLASCEFGEDAAQKAYKTALEEKELSLDTRQVIEKQRTTQKEAHDKIKRMRDAQYVHHV